MNGLQYYRHTQKGWVVLAALLLPAILMMPVIILRAGGGVVALVFLAIPAAVLGAILLLFGWMTITVDAEGIEARLGVGLIRKRVAFSAIRTYRAVRNPWYYGWGIRFFPGGTLYNVSGLSAVEFVLQDGGLVRLGTDELEALTQALSRAIGEPPPLSAAEAAVLRSRSKRSALILIGVSLVILLAVGSLLFVQSLPPHAAIANDAFVVSSGLYSAEMPLRQIENVSLDRTLPRVLLRTSGFALGGKLRGHFQVEDLGDVLLFVERDIPPYVRIQSRDRRIVIVNFEDSRRTEELYADLARGTGN